MRRFFANRLFGSQRTPEEHEAGPPTPNPAPENNHAHDPPESEHAALEPEPAADPDPVPEYLVLHGSVTNSLLSATPNPENLQQEPDEICAICQQPLHTQHDANVAIVTTPCGHRFCSPCINGWLDHVAIVRNDKLIYKCPLCSQEWNIIWDLNGDIPMSVIRISREGMERRGTAVFDQDALNELLLLLGAYLPR